MKIFDGIQSLSNPLSQSVMTIGNFDGIHLGHQKLLDHLVHIAQKLQAPSVVMTFDPHPRQVLSSKPLPFLPLFDRQDKKNIFQKRGIDYLIIEPFSKKVANISYPEFFEKWICKPFTPCHLVVGYDFSFGADRAGTLKQLKIMAKHNNIKLTVIPPVILNKHIVSSTYIRKLLSKGNVSQVAKLLGRSFYIRGCLQPDQRHKQNNVRQFTFQPQTEVALKGTFQTELSFNGQTCPCTTTINNPQNILVTIKNNDFLKMPSEKENIILIWNKKIV